LLLSSFAAFRTQIERLEHHFLERHGLQRDTLKPGVVFYGFISGCLPSMQKRGFGMNSFELSVQLGLERGFRLFCAEPSGVHSAKIMARNGWKLAESIAYAEIPALAAVPPPHTHLSLYEWEAPAPKSK
jgi:hypothetical protein